MYKTDMKDPKDLKKKKKKLGYFLRLEQANHTGNSGNAED